MNISNYNKTILALVFGAITVLEQWPTIDIKQAILAGLGTVLVYLVPNVPGATQEPPGNLTKVNPVQSVPSPVLPSSTESNEKA